VVCVEVGSWLNPGLLWKCADTQWVVDKWSEPDPKLVVPLGKRQAFSPELVERAVAGGHSYTVNAKVKWAS